MAYRPIENKIDVIKAYRNITSLGLQECLRDINAYQGGDNTNRLTIQKAIKEAKRARQANELTRQQEREATLSNIERQNAIAKAIGSLTLAEIESLKPDRVRASNELYEALRAASHHFKPLAEYGNAFDRRMLERMNEVLSKADGGK